MLQVDDLKSSYSEKKFLIQKRLREFQEIRDLGDDGLLFRELVFCILTAGTSAEMGINVIKNIEGVIYSGSRDQIRDKLRGIYRFYNVRSEYIVHTREYLKKELNFKINDLLLSFENNTKRRDYLALNTDIKGIGFKEASHFLRNIGYRGYAILDKHIINSLYELGVIKEKKLPSTRKKYLEIEKKYVNFSYKNSFDPDELDLLLWSEKTGKILK